VTAARNLTDADVEAIVDALERRGVVRARVPRSAPRAPVVVSEVDRALARKLARRAGIHVHERRKR
jgi:hypothetical protein